MPPPNAVDQFYSSLNAAAAAAAAGQLLNPMLFDAQQRQLLASYGYGCRLGNNAREIAFFK